MVFRALDRPFEEADFDAGADIVGEAWHNEGAPKEVARLTAGADLARCLERSTFSQVAVINTPEEQNVVAGIVLARSGRAAEADRLRWASREAELMTKVAAKDPRAVEKLYRYAREEDRINAELLEKGGVSDRSEVVLLAVDATARGMGIGSLLLDAAASYLRSEGGSSAYLFTDTSCSWSYYEERGLARAAAIKTPRHLRKFMCSAYYLYTLDLAD